MGGGEGREGCHEMQGRRTRLRDWNEAERDLEVCRMGLRGRQGLTRGRTMTGEADLSLPKNTTLTSARQHGSHV